MGNNFKRLAIADYTKNKKSLFLMMIITFLAAFSFFYLNYSVNTKNTQNITITLNGIDSNLNSYVMASEALNQLFILAVLVIISMSFSSYHQKKVAVLTMLLPASKAEKFGYIMLRNIIFIPLLLYFILYLNHTLWDLMVDVSSPFFRMIWTRLDVIEMLLSAIIVLVFAFASVCIRKYSLLVGAGIYIGIKIFFSISASKLPDMPNSYITTSILSLLLIGILYGIWWKYKNLQIK